MPSYEIDSARGEYPGRQPRHPGQPANCGRRESRFGAFVFGATGYVVLLLLQWTEKDARAFGTETLAAAALVATALPAGVAVGAGLAAVPLAAPLDAPVGVGSRHTYSCVRTRISWVYSFLKSRIGQDDESAMTPHAIREPASPAGSDR